MPVDLPTADALDTLAATIVAATVNSPSLDSQLYTLIAPLQATIDGHTLKTLPYTLNVTMALQLRKRLWYLRGITELDSTSTSPVCVTFEYVPKAGSVQNGNSSFGNTLGLATCAVICKIWAQIIRGMLATPPTYPSPDETSPATAPT